MLILFAYLFERSPSAKSKLAVDMPLGRAPALKEALQSTRQLERFRVYANRESRPRLRNPEDP